MTSPQHTVYLQIWRPLRSADDYSLVAQTFVSPSSLRFLEVRPAHPLHIQKGDILGLYFPDWNPVSFSEVPCSLPSQMIRYSVLSSVSHSQLDDRPDKRLIVGETFTVPPAPSSVRMCRHYSLTALFCKKFDNFIN